MARINSAPDLLGVFDHGVEDGGVLGIGDVFGHVGKVAVGRGMGPENLDIAETGLVQHRKHGRRPHAMQRRVEDFQIARAGHALGQHRPDERGVDFLLAIDHLAGGQRLGKRDALDRRDPLHPVDRRGVVGRHVLPAAGAIDLHRVVAGRIVAGGDDDAAIAPLVAHGERKLRRAAIAVEKVDRESGGGHDLGAKLGELPRAMPRIVGDGARERPVRIAQLPASASCVFAHLLHVVGQPLSGLADGAFVDGIASDRIHPAAASAGAEGDGGPKRLLQFGPFFRGQVLRHLGGIIAQDTAAVSQVRMFAAADADSLPAAAAASNWANAVWLCSCRPLWLAARINKGGGTSCFRPGSYNRGIIEAREVVRPGCDDGGPS